MQGADQQPHRPQQWTGGVTCQYSSIWMLKPQVHVILMCQEIFWLFSPNHFTKTGSESDVAPGLPFADPLPWGQQDKPQTHPLCPGAPSGEEVGPVGKGPYIKAIRIWLSSPVLRTLVLCSSTVASRRGEKSTLCFSLIYYFIFHFHPKRGKLLNAFRVPSAHNDIATLWRRKNGYKTCKILPTPCKIKLSPWRQTVAPRPMATRPPQRKTPPWNPLKVSFYGGQYYLIGLFF